MDEQRPPTYWWCLKHSQVEGEREGCPNTERLGPYETREEAEHALEKAHERTVEWDTDPRWKD